MFTIIMLTFAMGVSSGILVGSNGQRTGLAALGGLLAFTVAFTGCTLLVAAFHFLSQVWIALLT